LFLNNRLALVKPYLAAFGRLSRLLELVLKHVSLIGEVVEFVFSTVMALLGGDDCAELLVGILSNSGSEVFGVKGSKLFEGVDRGVALSA